MSGAAVVLIAVLAVVIIVGVVCVVRASTLKPATPVGTPLDAEGYRADDAAVERFCELLRVPTVSNIDPEKVDKAVFDSWVPTLRRLYPQTLASCELTLIDTYGILLRWPGSDPSLDPIVVMAHHDVVSVEGQEWKHDPFAAEIANGEIWARGTLDTKCIVGGFFEAAEYLISGGYVPPRDVWYFSSNGEEVSGPTCHDAVVWFDAHNIHPYLVLDEGGAVAADVPLGVKEPVAMVGVSEKGHIDLTVTARADGGHASTPDANDSARLLSRACERIATHPGAPYFTRALIAMLSELAARSSFLYRVIFANLWLTKPLVAKIMEGSGEMSAMIRSTYALTQLGASPQRNVISPTATANFNVRVAPFETIEDAVSRAREQAAAECKASGLSVDHVSVEPADMQTLNEPAPISPFENDAAFDYIHRCIAGVYPEVGVAPYIMNACTDSRQFNDICERVYRFCGFIYSAEARSLLHAPNERIGVDVYKRGIEFYVAFLKHLDRIDKLGS